MTRKVKVFILALQFCFFCLVFLAWQEAGSAEEVTVVYTGSTQAMLYPCNCPSEADGGVLRRGSLIKKLRWENPNLLLFDAGNFFAGGKDDDYSQNSQLDMHRSLLNLKAMALMGYDAVAVGSQEFNFGRDFLVAAMREAATINYLSANLFFDGADAPLKKDYLKEVGAVKFGVSAVTDLSASKVAAGSVRFSGPKESATSSVAELKKKGADFVILLSNLSEKENEALAKEIAGIGLIIASARGNNQQPAAKIGSTIIVRPLRQGRRLGRISLKFSGKKLVDYQADELRVSAEIEDDPALEAAIPRCFSDENCQHDGIQGICRNPAGPAASCLFAEAAESEVLVIVPQDCLVCNPAPFMNYLKKVFPLARFISLFYPGDQRAAKLVKELGIATLPVFIFSREIEKDAVFSRLKNNFIAKGNYYLIKPEISGFSYFVSRKRQKGRLDLFISLFDIAAPLALRAAAEFKPQVHFLAREEEGNFEALGGMPEIEEDIRLLCLQRHLPGKFWDYLLCRSANINSSWWQNCLGGADAEKVISCATSLEGKQLLSENIKLNDELGIISGPTFLIEDCEIFGIKEGFNQAELKRLIKKSEADNGETK